MTDKQNKKLLLTREDIIPILEKHYNKKSNVLDFVSFVKEILVKVKPIIEQQKDDEWIRWINRYVSDRLEHDLLTDTTEKVGKIIVIPYRVFEKKRKTLKGEK